VSRADAVTVASRFLEQRFGGALVPHVRDTEAWDPAAYDRDAARARLHVSAAEGRHVLGTPREHKGIDDLVEAVGLIGSGALLVMVGVDPAGGRARPLGRARARPDDRVRSRSTPSRYLVPPTWGRAAARDDRHAGTGARQALRRDGPGAVPSSRRRSR